MPAVKLLVVASPYDIERLQRAATAAGGAAVGVEEQDDFAEATAAFRPDAVIVVQGDALSLRDPLATLRRLRATAGAGTPIVFAGDGPAATQVERLADVVLRRPVPPETLVSRAIALALRPSRTPPERLPEAGPRLRQVAASIDDALDAEMLHALQTALDPPLAPAEAPARSAPLADPLGVPGLGPVGAALTDLFLWSELASHDGEPPGWIASSAGDDRSGSLADVDLPMLLGRSFIAGITGRLVVSRGLVEKTVYFEAGRPVFAASNNPNDRLIEILARRGRLTEAQHQMARQAALESGRKMGALLVDLGLITTSELLPTVREHYEELVLSLFTWSDGVWRVETGVMASPTQIRLLRHPAALVREGLRRGYPPERIWQRLGSPRNVFALDLRGTEVIAEIASDPAERVVPLLFDGVRPLDEVVGLTGLPETTVAEIALAAFVFDLLKPAGDRPGVHPSFPVRDRDIERERILTRHALALDGDYFEMLGVPRRASEEEIRHAYDLVGRELAPAALGLELARDLAREIEVIREVLEEALRVLGTEALRIPYEAALPPERSFDPDSRRLTSRQVPPSGRRSGTA
jgi:two-component system, OmpR family, response regulator